MLDIFFYLNMNVCLLSSMSQNTVTSVIFFSFASYLQFLVILCELPLDTERIWAFTYTVDDDDECSNHGERRIPNTIAKLMIR